MTEDEFLKAFGLRLTKIRIGKKISRVQLAKELKTNEKYLRLIERGEVSIGLKRLYSISVALNMPIFEIMDFDRDKFIWDSPAV